MGQKQSKPDTVKVQTFSPNGDQTVTLPQYKHMSDEMKFNSLMKLPSNHSVQGNGLYQSSKAIAKRLTHGDSEVTINGSYLAFRKCALYHIRKARKSIVVCANELNDTKIWEAIQQASQQLSVKILFKTSRQEELDNVSYDGNWQLVKVPDAASKASELSTDVGLAPVGLSSHSLSWVDTILPDSSLTAQSESANGSLLVKRLLWADSRMQNNFILFDSESVLLSSSDIDQTKWKIPMSSTLITHSPIANLYHNIFDKVDDHSSNFDDFRYFMETDGCEQFKYTTDEITIRFFPIYSNDTWKSKYSPLQQIMEGLKENMSQPNSTFSAYLNTDAIQHSAWKSTFIEKLSSISRQSLSAGNDFFFKSKFSSPLQEESEFPKFSYKKFDANTRSNNFSVIHRDKGECFSLFSTGPISGVSMEQSFSSQIMFWEGPEKEVQPQGREALLPGTVPESRKGNSVSWPINHAFMRIFDEG